MKTKKETTTKKTSVKEGILIGASALAISAAGYFLFGPNGKQNRKKIKAWTVTAKGEVLEKIERLENVAEEKYHNIVDQVANKYLKKVHIEDDEVEKFSKELKKYWKKIEKDLKPKKKASTKKKTPVKKTRTDKK